jgi:hypothetical protein
MCVIRSSLYIQAHDKSAGRFPLVEYPTNKKVPLSAKSAVGYPDNQLSSLGWIIFLLHWDKPCLTLGNPVRF